MDKIAQNKPDATKISTPAEVTISREVLVYIPKGYRELETRKAFLNTHNVVNTGANAVQNLARSILGGMPYSLAHDPNPVVEAHKQVAVTHSWLPVEKPSSLNKILEKFIIAKGSDPRSTRNELVIEALRCELKTEGLNGGQIDKWVKNCSLSLEGDINEDSIWVNRHACFLELWKEFGLPETDRLPAVIEILDMCNLSINNYFEIYRPENTNYKGGEGNFDCGQKARLFLSNRAGTGKKTNFELQANVAEKISECCSKALKNGSISRDPEILFSEIRCLPAEKTKMEGISEAFKRQNCKHPMKIFFDKHAKNPPDKLNTEDLVFLEKYAHDFAVDSYKKHENQGPREYSSKIIKYVEEKIGIKYRDGKSNQIKLNTEIFSNAMESIRAHITNNGKRYAERLSYSSDSIKINQVTPEAKCVLDKYKQQYGERTKLFSIFGTLINKWGELPDGGTEQLRLNIANSYIAENHKDKMYGIGLELMASDMAKCVWFPDGKINNNQFQDYLVGSKAKEKIYELKVPCFTHADQYLHPVRTRFGPSRQDISFDTNKNLETQNPHALSIELVSEDTTSKFYVEWRSDQLTNELGLPNLSKLDNFKDAPSNLLVPLNTEKHRLASGLDKNSVCYPKKLMEGNFLSNGRLIFKDEVLKKINKIMTSNKDELTKQVELEKLLMQQDSIYLSLTLKITPDGPHVRACNEKEIPFDPKTLMPNSILRQNLEDGRFDDAKIQMSRLPEGTRILGFDLGIRYWGYITIGELVSNASLVQKCENYSCAPPNPTDTHFVLKKTGETYRNGKVKAEHYIRINYDNEKNITCNGEPICEWIKIEPSYPIVLPGQSKKNIRALTASEILSLHELERILGFKNCLIDQLEDEGYFNDPKKSSRISLLNKLKQLGFVSRDPRDPGENPKTFFTNIKASLGFHDTVKGVVSVLSQCVQRHANAAKICYYLVATEKPLSDGKSEQLTTENLTEMICQAIKIWISYMSDDKFDCTKEKELWEREIVPLLSDALNPDLLDEKQIQRISECILANTYLRDTLHAAWKKIWEDDDRIIMKEGKYLTQLIFGKYPKIKNMNDDGTVTLSKDKLAIYHRGNLTPEMISLKKYYYRIMCSFFTRLRCDGTSKALEENFGSTYLKSIMQSQDTVQDYIIHFCMMIMLGYSQKDVTQFLQSMNGKAKSIHDIQPDPSKQIHVFVMEDLSNFKFDKSRPKQVNRNIGLMRPMSFMDKAKATLTEHGCLFTTANPAFTSRRCALTGAPGVRCREVRAVTFQNSSFYQEKVIFALSKHPAKRTDYDKLILSASEQIKNLDDNQKERKTFIFPEHSGPLFISSDQLAPQNTVNADANGSCNVLLKSTRDPDYHVSYHSVFVNAQTLCLDRNSMGGCHVFNYTEPLSVTPNPRTVSKSAKPAENTTEPAESPGETPEDGRQLPPIKKQKSKRLLLFQSYPFGRCLAESTFMLPSVFFNMVFSDAIKNMMALNELPKCRGSP